MARPANQDRLQELYQHVEEHPGQKAGWLARLLGWNRSEVTRSLPALEERGYFLSEDEQGRLWPFPKEK